MPTRDINELKVDLKIGIVGCRFNVFGISAEEVAAAIIGESGSIAATAVWAKPS